MGTRSDAQEIAFVEFAAAAQPALLRTAVLLTGDWHTAEDLVQAAFVRVYLRWGKSDTWDSPVAYARRVVANLYATGRRRRWHAEIPHDSPTQVRAEADPADRVVAQREIVRALAELPRAQRAVLVLRFYEDLSVEETAQALNCSTGTVKSRTQRGLQRLRATKALDHYMEGSAR